MNKSFKPLALIALTGSCFIYQAIATQIQTNTPKQTVLGKLNLGEIEWVYLPRIDQNVKARVDSGASISSVSATNIKLYIKSKANKWSLVDQFDKSDKEKFDDGKLKAKVKFKLAHHGMTTSDEQELPVVGIANVRQSTSESLDYRPVVKLTTKIGGRTDKTEFTLVDRQHLKLPMLLGRTLLQNKTIIDVSHSFIQLKTPTQHPKKGHKANTTSDHSPTR